jgi:hypothetical protein
MAIKNLFARRRSLGSSSRGRLSGTRLPPPSMRIACLQAAPSPGAVPVAGEDPPGDHAGFAAFSPARHSGHNLPHALGITYLGVGGDVVPPGG